jgi:hypothetical protein
MGGAFAQLRRASSTAAKTQSRADASRPNLDQVTESSGPSLVETCKCFLNMRATAMLKDCAEFAWMFRLAASMPARKFRDAQRLRND